MGWYLEGISLLAAVDIVRADIVEDVRELNKSQGGREGGVKVEAHGCFRRGGIIGVHITIQD